MPPSASQYRQHTPEGHVLARPDMYVGSTERITAAVPVHDGESYGSPEERLHSPAFLKTVDEVLTNVLDQNESCKGGVGSLSVTMTADRITVRNTGSYVPVEKHASGKLTPSVVFFQLLTSENYDDEAGPRYVGGRNGVGAKATLIFATEATVEVADPRKKKLFRQTCRDHMTVVEEPTVEALAERPEPYVSVSWKPDLARFGGMKSCLEAEDMVRARVAECAALMGPACEVTYDGARMEAGLEALVRSQVPADTTLHHDVVKAGKKVRAEVYVGFSEVPLSLGWVNGVRCCAGTHVDAVVGQVAKAVVKMASKRRKEPVPERLVRSRLFVAVRALVDSPAFDSQAKVKLTTPASKLGYDPALHEGRLTKGIEETPIVDAILDLTRFKEQQSLKRAVSGRGGGRSRPKDVPKYDSANKAGHKGHACTLIVTEGDSAKSLAVAGLSVVGRDHYGVFPLKGKPLNAMNAGSRKLQANAECVNICKILGSQPDAKLEDPAQLRYQQVLVFSDQDLDGYHITALLVNMLAELWPGLMRACPTFVRRFATPLIVAKRGAERVNFYNAQEYNTWQAATPDAGAYAVRYLKGLGSSTVADAKLYFRDLDTNSVYLTYDGAEDRAALQLAFDQSRADDRKAWLGTYDPEEVLDYRQESFPVERYVHAELKHFSVADNVRALPNLADGFKPAQRKVLWSCRRRGVTRDTKVSELAANVAGDAQYHHGSASLEGTIVGMAQDFSGSNNWPLLHPEGQFGTQVNHKAAAPRYIFSRLDARTAALFRAEDDPVLEHLSDEGKGIEPRCFWPVVPTLLLNGSAGIGTGYSTYVPPVDPEVLMDYVAARVEGREPPAPLVPWWMGHTGPVTEVAPGKYQVGGVFHRPDPATVEVTELPPGRSSDWFQEHLLQRCVVGHVDNAKPDQTFVRNFQNHSTTERPRFVLACDRALLEALDDEAVSKALKLTDAVSLTNMHVFDPSGQEIRRYESLGAIADAFVEARLPVYEARLAHQVKHLEETELPALTSRAEWIRAVVEGEVDLRNLPKASAEAEIARRGLGDPAPLLGMSLLSMTRERYAALLQERERKAEELRELRATEPRDVWLREIEEARAAWRGGAREEGKTSAEEQSPLNSSRPAKRRKTTAAASSRKKKK